MEDHLGNPERALRQTTEGVGGNHRAWAIACRRPSFKKVFQKASVRCHTVFQKVLWAWWWLMVLGCRRHSPGGLLQQENCVASKLQKSCLIEKCRCPERKISISKEKQMQFHYDILSPLSKNGSASEAVYEL